MAPLTRTSLFRTMLSQPLAITATRTDALWLHVVWVEHGSPVALRSGTTHRVRLLGRCGWRCSSRVRKGVWAHESRRGAFVPPRVERGAL